MKSLHYEKLKGKRSHQRSMKLNDQFRLIVEIENKNGRTVVVLGIEKHYE
jgi:toxin HigB-1